MVRIAGGDVDGADGRERGTRWPEPPPKLRHPGSAVTEAPELPAKGLERSPIGQQLDDLWAGALTRLAVWIFEPSKRRRDLSLPRAPSRRRGMRRACCRTRSCWPGRAGRRGRTP